MNTRFEERKSVDRAKGILMQARQVSDDDAFALLRSAAMRSKQRLGQLSQQIIQSAQSADALNRAGQLRMLSQRLVKLQLLRNAGVQAAQQDALLAAWCSGWTAILRRCAKRFRSPPMATCWTRWSRPGKGCRPPCNRAAAWSMRHRAAPSCCCRAPSA